MKQAIDNSTKGVSDLISTILMVILVIGLAAVITAFLMPGFIQKSVYIASEVKAIPITYTGGSSSRSVEVLGLLSKAGDPFYIIGQPPSYKSGTPVSVRVLGPDGVNHTWSEITLPSENLYGTQIYIYPPNYADPLKCDLCMSYIRPEPKNLSTMDQGKWTIQFVDENAHILVMSNSDGVITNGSTTSKPSAGRYPGDLYNNHCLPLSVVASNLDQYKVNPNMNNMKYQTFNGTQYAFVEYDSLKNPELSYNGDMAISMWYNPTTNLSYNPSGDGWHQLIGKGQTISAGSGLANENDNYQVMQLGNQLLFEWNDATTGEHYQAVTPPTILANQWNYLTVTVQNGHLNIYNNGEPLLLTYNHNNVPYATPIVAPPNGVNLRTNDNSMYIGNQYQSNYQYSYVGDIGSMALYNWALTPDEIKNNYNYFNA